MRAKCWENGTCHFFLRRFAQPKRITREHTRGVSRASQPAHAHRQPGLLDSQNSTDNFRSGFLRYQVCLLGDTGLPDLVGERAFSLQKRHRVVIDSHLRVETQYGRQRLRCDHRFFGRKERITTWTQYSRRAAARRNPSSRRSGRGTRRARRCGRQRPPTEPAAPAARQYRTICGRFDVWLNWEA